MVKILGWEIRRIRVDDAYDICDVCRQYSYTRKRVAAPTELVRGVNLCPSCRCSGVVRRRLDLEYWHEHPEEVPVCKNCCKSIPPEQLEAAVLRDWYFCPECVSKPEVIRHFEALEQKSR